MTKFQIFNFKIPQFQNSKYSLILLLLLFFVHNPSFAQYLNEENSPVKWLSFDELEEAMKKNPKKILVDIYTDWCVYCRMLDDKTLQNKEIADFLNTYFYCVKLNAEKSGKVNFNDETYQLLSHDGAAMHELSIALYGKSDEVAYPALILLNENYEILFRHVGYIKSKELSPLLEFLGKDIYKDQSWEDFKKNQKAAGKRKG